MQPSAMPLFALPEKPLVGIARLASQGESLREGHDVEYFTLPAKSVLNRCASRRGVPFEWTINPYRGCEFACKYCYARYTHEFMEMRDGVDFERKIYVKQHTAELLRQELRLSLIHILDLGAVADNGDASLVAGGDQHVLDRGVAGNEEDAICEAEDLAVPDGDAVGAVAKDAGG